MARWSSGQDGGLSRRKREFDSPTGHQKSVDKMLAVWYIRKRVGVNSGEGTPVPIPNTVVKLVYGDNTWLATAREDSSSPTPVNLKWFAGQYSSIAQLVEHAAVNRRVVGSSPT